MLRLIAPLAILAAATPALASALDEAISDIQTYASRMHAYSGADGIIYIAQAENEPHIISLGHANRETQSPWSAETITTVGSISKQFTGAALTLLAQQGKLDFADTLAEFFPNVPSDKAAITVHQLLTHTAGFPPALGSDEEHISRDDYLARAWGTPLLFEPGDHHEYSNTGYSIAAAIVEAVAEQPFSDFLTENLFGPAGMTDSGIPSAFADSDRLAVGYRGDDRWGTVAENAQTDGFTWHLQGNGGIHSTPRDMHKWWLAIRDNTILNHEFTELYLAPHADEGSGDSFYSYGWVNFEAPDGQRFLSHNGGNGYYFADCAFFPETDTFIFIASNDPASANIDSFELIIALAGHELSIPPDPATLDIDALNEALTARSHALLDTFNADADTYLEFTKTQRVPSERTDTDHINLFNTIRDRFGTFELLEYNAPLPFESEILVRASNTDDPLLLRVTLEPTEPYLISALAIELGGR